MSVEEDENQERQLKKKDKRVQGEYEKSKTEKIVVQKGQKERNKAQQANDASMRILSTLSTFSTLSTLSTPRKFSYVNVRLPR